MSKVVGTIINRQKSVESMRPLQLLKRKRAFATICSEELQVPEIALLSDAVFAQELPLSEEDAAGSHLPPE